MTRRGGFSTLFQGLAWFTATGVPAAWGDTGTSTPALDEVVVDGIETTLPLFRALVREPAIIDGDYHIHWLEQYLAG